MQVVIRAADATQVNAIRDAIKAIVEEIDGLSLGSVYVVQSLIGSRDEILIFLIPDDREIELSHQLFSNLQNKIIESLSLDHRQLRCATRWR